ncbi:MAG: hypothetical protein LBF15_05025 [Candidatus Peribacteria bacterium]|nr:hypothetical protein [Candidatus Peribacteria bacterium]
MSHLILSVLDRFTEIFDKEVYQKGLSAYINHKRDTFKEETLTSAVSGESFNIDWSAKL